MEPFRLTSFKVLLLLLLQVISSLKTHQAPLNESHVNNDLEKASPTTANETYPPSDVQDKLESPLIVLMAHDTISVAQLPMIEYGNVFEIYRLPPNEQDIADTDPDELDQRSLGRDEDEQNQPDARALEEGGEDSAVSRRRNREHADAREYEQMPHPTATANNMTTSSASLGKSQWQQIAASERDREEVWPPPQPATQTNSNRKKSHEEDDDGQADERPLGQPRRRRSSNSLSDEQLLAGAGNDGGAEAEAGATSEAQTSRRVSSALESNAQQNVTSAQSGRQPLNLVLEEAGGAESTEGEAEGKGDKTSPANATRNPASRHASSSSPVPDQKRVRFSDFDVHMASGYAFAADSLGRIHRFKLPLSGKQWAGTRLPAPLMNAQPGWRIVSSSENSTPSGNDDTNAIEANAASEIGARKSDASSSLSDHQLADASLNFSPAKAVISSASGQQLDANHEDAYGNKRKEQGADSNDVDKVGQSGRGDGGSSDVTHEQFGNVRRQHPVISGLQNAPAPGTDDAAAASIGYRKFEQQLVASRSDNFKADAATPRVIWSRNKHARAPLTAATVSSSAGPRKSLHRQQLANVEGASTTADGNQLADERTEGESADGLHLRSGVRHDSDAPDGNQSEESSDAKGGTEKRRQSTAGRRLRTEIAVDWQSNLLFVLDKCRLLVMDFDGNNELVLIDDFTSANRPIDIKLDPINDILFWLQVGKFHNTIYKLDLSLLSLPSSTDKLVSNALYLRQSRRANDNGSNFDASVLVPLSSHHYAHPIITNLPRSAKIFTIDHKHSRIYVPLVNLQSNSDSLAPSDDQLARNEAEIFASTGNITHLNTTETESSANGEHDCHRAQTSQNTISATEGNRILAYNLDGTDVGPFRAEENYLSKFDDMQDLTLNVKNNLLYWLTNSGRDLVEEAKEGSAIQLSQHKLNNISYSKLIYFDNNGFNQPRSSKPRFNVGRMIHVLFASVRNNRQTDGSLQALENGPSPIVKGLDTAKYSQNAPFIILGATCLIVVAVYLIYALVIQQATRRLEEESGQCRDGSVSGGSSSTADSRVGSNLNGFINSSTISRWIAGPSAHNTDTSSFNRDGSTGNGPYDIESTNYEASNAIDEHYRDSIAQNSQLFEISSGPLANLNEWPTNMHDRSNKLYVPVEVLQDDALSSIRRVSIDQLEIEKTAPLGEGHFGTVLQGKIKCTLYERTFLLDKSQMNGTFNHAPISPDSLEPSGSRAFAVSSASSGHGSSSSTSCEFTTANTCTETTNDEDYLTPKNQLNSTSSDYCIELPQGLLRDESCIEHPNEVRRSKSDSKVSTKLRVAIKKLKDNASVEEKRDFLQEAKLLANFDHPNIVHLIGICLDRGSTLIVMELMLGGDLIRYMQESTPNSMNNPAEQLTYDDLLKICLDIANGCCYLEDMDYIHRDLAARNCLVSSRKREERVVKLADFGLARDIYKDSYYKKLNDSAMPLKWMAPECLIEQRFTKKSDVWSFGVVMWEVMSYCQEKPYVGVEPFFMKEHLASGARLRKPGYCDDDMYKLMNQCWQIDSESRPTFHECRAMLIEIRNKTRS